MSPSAVPKKILHREALLFTRGWIYFLSTCTLDRVYYIRVGCRLRHKPRPAVYLVSVKPRTLVCDHEFKLGAAEALIETLCASCRPNCSRLTVLFSSPTLPSTSKVKLVLEWHPHSSAKYALDTCTHDVAWVRLTSIARANTPRRRPLAVICGAVDLVLNGVACKGARGGSILRDSKLSLRVVPFSAINTTCPLDGVRVTLGRIGGGERSVGNTCACEAYLKNYIQSSAVVICTQRVATVGRAREGSFGTRWGLSRSATIWFKPDTHSCP